MHWHQKLMQTCVSALPTGEVLTRTSPQIDGEIFPVCSPDTIENFDGENTVEQRLDSRLGPIGLERKLLSDVSFLAELPTLSRSNANRSGWTCCRLSEIVAKQSVWRCKTTAFSFDITAP